LFVGLNGDAGMFN